mgnify:CR=1 FL=1
MKDSSGSNASETLTLDNYGTISGRSNTVKIAVNSTGATINNYSGATIEATDTNNNNTNAKAAIRIDVNDVFEKLAKNGIFVRKFSDKNIKNSLRISAGTPDQTRKLLRVLETII